MSRWPPGTANPMPWHRSPGIAVAAAGGVIVGVGAWLVVRELRRRQPQAQPAANPAPPQLDPRQCELLEQLLARSPDLDIADLGDVIRGVQETYGLQPDGRWSPAVEHAVIGLLAGGYHQDVEYPEGRAPAGPHDLEPEGNWESTYEADLTVALGQCLADPRVATFDQAVVSTLARLFPDSGSFAACCARAPWKHGVQERVRRDLAERLGPTEAEARAALTARTVGLRAVAGGADVGQAVRAMGEYAFPTASWSGGEPWDPWQRLFAQRAAHELQALQPNEPNHRIKSARPGRTVVQDPHAQAP